MKGRKLFTAALIALATLSCNKDDDAPPVSNTNNLSATDQNFMRMAAHSNYNEIDGGQLANSKATDQSVRNFGSLMVSDHTTAQNELETIAQQKNMSIPNGPDSMHMALKQQLMNMQGNAFDSAYIHSQLEAHQKAINLFQDEINNGTNQDVINYANKYLPKIQMHYHMADSIADRF